MDTMQADIEGMLKLRTVAVVGLSDKPERASHQVAAFLQRHGHRIVPVNPNHAGESILGERCHASLHDAAQALAAEGARIDWVDIFRKAPDVPPVVDDAIAIGARGVWLQLGIVNDDALARAKSAGLMAVQDRCSKIESMRG
ncbi:CoA-binding protein [Cupriavidus gilardii]|uniref:CoA-binding protein n=1 Tax=Cupriavidus gilardii TaxID=82541 RepID=UPI001572868E|nr:CoA-binding protein [Cupriavidus gilardii]MCG5259174.1 CoA-binding protein [Cupriavidus gilardii]MDF9428742.1 CoA-binding protein [Cupriavidus gilardii]NSX03751.1 CoA-binding protein [Cupriavidus gilardii]